MNAPYIKRIFIVGPSSTGKTTLCSALAKRLDISPNTHISEVARTVMKTQSFTRNDVGKLGMQKAIIQAQLKREIDIEEGCRSGILLSDRSAIDAVVYAMLTAESEEAKGERWRALVEQPEFQSALQRYRASTVILLKPVPEWLFDDGVRSIYDQEECNKEFVIHLKRLNIPFHEIGMECLNVDERVELVVGWARSPGLLQP